MFGVLYAKAKRLSTSGYSYPVLFLVESLAFCSDSFAFLSTSGSDLDLVSVRFDYSVTLHLSLLS